MPLCQHCQSELPAGAKFCPQCGGAVGERARFAALEQMVSDYQRALRDNPNNDDARFNLGLAYLHQGQDGLAIAELERVRERAADYADVHYWLAVLYHRRGDREQARQSCEAALALEPQHPAAKRLGEKLKVES